MLGSWVLAWRAHKRICLRISLLTFYFLFLLCGRDELLSPSLSFSSLQFQSEMGTVKEEGWKNGHCGKDLSFIFYFYFLASFHLSISRTLW